MKGVLFYPEFRLYNPLVYLYGLDEALAISRHYLTQQARFARAELCVANRLTVNQAQWEINFLAHNQSHDVFYVDLQVDVPSGMIFEVNIARAAQPYDS